MQGLPWGRKAHGKKWLPLVFRELLWASLALGGSSEKAARNESRGNGVSD